MMLPINCIDVMESVRQGNIYFYGNSLPTLYTNKMKKVPLILCVKKGNYFKTINKKMFYLFNTLQRCCLYAFSIQI